MNSIPPPRRLSIPHRSTRLGLLCLLLTMAAAAVAETPSSIMSKAMIAMMDAMGDLALQYKGRGGWSLGNGYSPYTLYNRYDNPWKLYTRPGRYPGADRPGVPPLQPPLPGYRATPYPPLPGRSAVDGIWLGQGGELVLVMYGHFRIYASAERYRDGLFEILDDKLLMYDPRSGLRMTFDYWFEEGRMMLRSPNGTVMLFKQLPIPIPPQGLFFD